MERPELTIVDIVAARERRAIEDDRRALEVARQIVTTEPGPWTRVSLVERIMERAGVKREVAVTAEDTVLFDDDLLAETDEWTLVRANQGS